MDLWYAVLHRSFSPRAPQLLIRPFSGCVHCSSLFWSVACVYRLLPCLIRLLWILISIGVLQRTSIALFAYLILTMNKKDHTKESSVLLCELGLRYSGGTFKFVIEIWFQHIEAFTVHLFIYLHFLSNCQHEEELVIRFYWNVPASSLALVTVTWKKCISIVTEI